jgi:hypothetical protein
MHMRRPLVAAALAAAALLLVTPALAGAGTAGHKAGPPRSGRPAAAGLSGAWSRMLPRFAPAPQAVASASTADIAGTVFRYDGSPLAGAEMAWWIDGVDIQGGGWTDANGKYSFEGIPPADGDGTVRVDAVDGSLSMAWWDLTWTEAGPNAFDLQPGGVAVKAVNGGPWGHRTSGMYVDFYSAREADGTGGWAGGTLPRLAGVAPAFPGTVFGGDVYFYPDEGLEVYDVAGDTVEPGKRVPGGVFANEAQAQRIWTGVSNPRVLGPWGSGKPGTTLKLWLQNYPKDWMVQLLGWSLDGERTAFKVYGQETTTGASKYAIALQVPDDATPGYGYDIDVMHTNGGPLTLDTWFQVCTLEPRRSSIEKGQAVRLDGVIPVEGHEPGSPGKSSRAYVWVHDGRAAQPATVVTRQLKAAGWRCLGYVRTDGNGTFTTPPVRLQKTSTVVAYYPGDACYCPAFTSPVRVSVK